MYFGYFTLLVALVISVVAAYYSIVGLTAIFSAAVIPIIIMGAALEVGKVTAAVWLKLHWSRAKWTYKLYLVPAVAALMFLTSMGIFGFLSKAHSDQSLISGDVAAKIAIYDEKIKTSKENIDANRRALKQLDEAVDQVMGRSTSEAGADKAVQIRRSQANDRKRLLAEIAQEQKVIAKLNEEAAPIRAEVRKVEAEVGPIKYIAALIYGDNPDANLLESAVRWVIILIVAVFDPLALVLILSAQQSLRWAKEDQLAAEKPPQDEQGSDSAENINVIKDDLPPAPPVEPVGIVAQEVADVIPEAVTVKEPSILEQHPYLTKPFDHFKGLKPMVYKPEEAKQEEVEEEPIPDIPDVERPGDYLVPPTPKHYYKILNEDYLEVDGKMIHKRVLKDLYPDVYAEIEATKLQDHLLAKADNVSGEAIFGTEFPTTPAKGQLFLNVASLPSRLYKFNGTKWIEVDKSITDSYTYNDDYLSYLVEKINAGHISIDDLTIKEQEQIEEYLKNAKSNNYTS